MQLGHALWVALSPAVILEPGQALVFLAVQPGEPKARFSVARKISPTNKNIAVVWSTLLHVRACFHPNISNLVRCLG